MDVPGREGINLDQVTFAKYQEAVALGKTGKEDKADAVKLPDQDTQFAGFT